MAVTTNTPQEQSVQAPSMVDKLLYPKDDQGTPKTPFMFITLVIVLATVVLGAYRVYMETTAFTLGLDYFEPEFEIYWMRMLYAQGIIIPLIGAIGLPWLWFTRPSAEEVNAMPASKELGHYILIFSVMAAASFLIVAILGLFVEADAAWHQVTIRDTDFTPTHIQLFYGVIPIGAVGLVLGLVWLHTRMPDYQGRVSIPLFIVASAPLLIMPNLGYNEWGHTFFYAEELFAAPVHYGFVMLGWGFFAISGFIIECIKRVIILTKVTDETQAA